MARSKAGSDGSCKKCWILDDPRRLEVQCGKEAKSTSGLRPDDCRVGWHCLPVGKTLVEQVWAGRRALGVV